MESTQTTQRRVRYQFEIFCMKVIDGERCDYLRKLMKKMEWESSFSDLPETVLTSLCTFDSDPAEQYIFHVYGHQIPIRNDRLAEMRGTASCCCTTPSSSRIGRSPRSWACPGPRSRRTGSSCSTS